VVSDKPQFITIKDVAKILNVNERTVLKLAQTNQIPAVKIASQWRFSAELIMSYLHSQMRFGFGSGKAVPKDARISDYLEAANIKVGLASTDKEGVLREMVGVVEKEGFIRNSGIFLKALADRERMCSTGIGRGIALLHSRRIVTGLIERPFLALGISRSGIDFDAIDGEPVNVFFLLGLEKEELHLQMMSRISSLFLKGEVFSRVRDAESGEEILKIFEEYKV